VVDCGIPTPVQSHGTGAEGLTSANKDKALIISAVVISFFMALLFAGSPQGDYRVKNTLPCRWFSLITFSNNNTYNSHKVHATVTNKPYWHKCAFYVAGG